MNGCITSGKCVDEKKMPESSHIGSMTAFINPETVSVLLVRQATSTVEQRKNGITAGVDGNGQTEEREAQAARVHDRAGQPNGENQGKANGDARPPAGGAEYVKEK